MSMRAAHRLAVLTFVLDHGPSTARDIAEKTGLSIATVNGISREALDRGLLEVARPRPAARGPWARTYTVPPAALRASAAVHDGRELVATAASGSVVTRAAAGDRLDTGLVARVLTAAARQAGFRAASIQYAVVGVTPWSRSHRDLAHELRERLGHGIEVRRSSALSALAEAGFGGPDYVVVEGSPTTTLTHVLEGVPQRGAHGRAGALSPTADLARAVADACALLDPGLVVLGRDLPRLLEAELRELLPEGPEVVGSAVPDDAALRGALQLARAGARAAFLAGADQAPTPA